MELTAAIKALEALTRSCNVELYTDSKYVKYGIENWLFYWKNNNSKKAAKKPLKNLELWRVLDILNSKHHIK